MAQVTVSINGRTFRMACDEGEQERLMGLARRFDGAIETLRRQFGEIGDQRLTVMAGVMVVDQLNEAERRIAFLEQEVDTLRHAASSSGERRHEVEDGIALRLDQAAERLELLADSLMDPIRAENE
ncbi:cell division protein ZapA [Segnochrobactraceae bacterium EtOH-i3]